MKKIVSIIFVFQYSLLGFSQSSEALHHYTDSEVAKLTGYISKLEEKIPPDFLSNSEEKKLIADLLKDPSHAYSDGDIIKISKYIKELKNGRKSIS